MVEQHDNHLGLPFLYFFDSSALFCRVVFGMRNKTKCFFCSPFYLEFLCQCFIASMFSKAPVRGTQALKHPRPRRYQRCQSERRGAKIFNLFKNKLKEKRKKSISLTINTNNKLLSILMYSKQLNTSKHSKYDNDN